LKRVAMRCLINGQIARACLQKSAKLTDPLVAGRRTRPVLCGQVRGIIRQRVRMWAGRTEHLDRASQAIIICAPRYSKVQRRQLVVPDSFRLERGRVL
jgi:hypothetical protein